MEFFQEAYSLALNKNQTVGKRKDYYVTLEQLNNLLKVRVGFYCDTCKQNCRPAKPKGSLT